MTALFPRTASGQPPLAGATILAGHREHVPVDLAGRKLEVSACFTAHVKHVARLTRQDGGRRIPPEQEALHSRPKIDMTANERLALAAPAASSAGATRRGAPPAGDATSGARR